MIFIEIKIYNNINVFEKLLTATLRKLLRANCVRPYAITDKFSVNLRDGTEPVPYDDNFKFISALNYCLPAFPLNNSTVRRIVFNEQVIVYFLKCDNI